MSCNLQPAHKNGAVNIGHQNANNIVCQNVISNSIKEQLKYVLSPNLQYIDDVSGCKIRAGKGNLVFGIRDRL